MSAVRRVVGATVCGLALGSAAGGPAPAGASPAARTEADGARQVAETWDGAARFHVETLARGLEVPWSIVWTPDGRMLFTERPGRVRVIEKGRLRPEPLATIADVEPSSESGLMGMTLHPRFSVNRLLYLAYAYRGDGKRVRVVRFRETGSGLANRKVIIEGIPAAPNYAGTRLGFGLDGKLYITTGDATDRRIAQDLGLLGGKTLRLNDDGTVPADNPFTQRAGARPEIWSYRHRNAQGLDWQPGMGRMFQTEHGPSGFDGPGGGDEVNIVERGKNYGWPVVHHEQTHPGMEPPLLQYTPAIAPASGTFYCGSAFPELRSNFLFGGLRGRCIVRVVLDGPRVVRQERLMENQYGRIREVAVGPEGAVYFSTSNRDGRGSPARTDDRILRLVPAEHVGRVWGRLRLNRPVKSTDNGAQNIETLRGGLSMSRPVVVRNAADRAPRNVPDETASAARAATVTWSPAAQALPKSLVAKAVAEARAAALSRQGLRGVFYGCS